MENKKKLNSIKINISIAQRVSEHLKSCVNMNVLRDA